MGNPVSQFSIGVPSTATSGDTFVVIFFSDQPIIVPAAFNQFLSGTAGTLSYSASSHTVTSTDISAGTIFTWQLAGSTLRIGYTAYDFANITALDTTATTVVDPAALTLPAPSLNVSNNETVLAFWIAINETGIAVPNFPTQIAGTIVRGFLSIASIAYSATGNGATGIQTANLDVASSGLAAQASLKGAGAHINGLSAGTLG